MFFLEIGCWPSLSLAGWFWNEEWPDLLVRVCSSVPVP